MTARAGISESVVEDLLLDWLGSLGYEIRHGAEIAPGEPGAERDDYREVLLLGRVEAALRHLNPTAPEAAIAGAIRQIRKVDTPDLVAANRRFHRMLVEGLEVELPAPGGGVRGHHLRRLDFGGAPHTNPDGELVGVPHLHLYREGYGDRWAYPLPQDRFGDPVDRWRLFEEFMAFCNVTRVPNIPPPLSA